MKRVKVAVWVVMVIGVVWPLLGRAQEPTGLPLVQTALDLAHQNCTQISRNQACYGHALLTANPQSAATPLRFTAAGDIEDLAKIQSLRLNGLDLDAGTWGVALMQLRASLSTSQTENVTLIAFGDVALQNAVLLPTHAEIQVNTDQYLNVRQFPSTQAGVIGVLEPRQTVTAVERLEDGSWVRVLLPDSEDTGWVTADLVTGQEAVQALNIGDRINAYYEQPMQAFYFTSGTNDPAFSQLPANGLLIQTPEGVGEVQLLINEINVQLGSTVFFQAQPGQQMTVSTLEGHADLRAFGIEQTAYAGTQVSIPLTADLKPSGPPSPPQPYDLTQVNQLPTALLTRSVTAAEPMTYTEIEERLNQRPGGNSTSAPGSDDNGVNTGSNPGGNTSPGGDTNPGPGNPGPGGTLPTEPGEGGGDPIINNPDPGEPAPEPGDPANPDPDGNGNDGGGNNDNCPGNSCNAPGHGGTCPGNSCNAPGHNKGDKDKGKGKN